jgi:hypothetical protein
MGMPAKSLSEIKIKQTRTSTATGTVGEIAETVVFLSQKVDEFIVKMGYSSAHTLGIITQLLNVGKIRVEFRDFNERLQLVDSTDAIPRAEAMVLTETYIASILTKDDGPDGLELTQKVIVQAPKRTGR